MDDDFNTADALAAVFELVKFANTNVDEKSSGEFAGSLLDILVKLCGVLGLIVLKKEEALDSDIEALDVYKRQCLAREDVMEIRKYIKPYSPRLYRALGRAARQLLEIKKEGETERILESTGTVSYTHLVFLIRADG